MLSTRIDATGRLNIVWPIRDADIIALGKAYTTFEGQESAQARLALPTYAQVLALLEAASAAADSATGSETQRAISATDLANALTEAKVLLIDALKQLKGRYSKNPAQLERYGLPTKIGTRGEVLVTRPATAKDWARFLAAYVTQQAELDEAERLTDPALAKMQALNQIVTQALTDRLSGRNQREVGVQNRSAAATRLLEHLQLAAFALVVTRFDGHVVNELQNWGFNIVAKTTPEEPAPVTNPIEPVAA